MYIYPDDWGYPGKKHPWRSPEPVIPHIPPYVPSPSKKKEKPVINANSFTFAETIYKYPPFYGTVDTESERTITFIVPGYTKNSIVVQRDDKNILVSGELVKPIQHVLNKFDFSIDCKGFDTTKLKAKLDNGILTITLPKIINPESIKTLVDIE